MPFQCCSSRGVIRLVLAGCALIGFGFTIHYNLQRFHLQRVHQELNDRVGLLKIDDPKQVAVMGIPFLPEEIPPGVQKAHVWKFRVYCPSKFDGRSRTYRGLIRPDSPYSAGGSSGGLFGGGNQEPEEITSMVSMVKSDGQWTICYRQGGGSSSFSASDELGLDDINELLVEPIVEPGQTRVFNVNEAICLFRIRHKEEAVDRSGKPQPGLYQGFAAYLFSQQIEQPFDDWAKGNIETLEEALR